MLNGTDETGKKTPYPLGHFFFAINVEHFTPLGSFWKIAGDILLEL